MLSIEDIVLTSEPFRKGAPQSGFGNVIGSVVFSMTGILGIILLAGGRSWSTMIVVSFMAFGEVPVGG